MTQRLEVWAGTSVEITTTFRLPGGALADPGAVTLTVIRPHDPAEAPVPLAPTSVGVYTHTVATSNDPGVWRVVIAGTGGAVQAIGEYEFVVKRPPTVPTPPIP